MKEIKKPTGLIQSHDIVRAKKVRNEIELYNITLCNRKTLVRRLEKGRHVNIETGEIYEDKIGTTRGCSMNSLIASNLKLKDIIKENTIDCKKLLLLTLTYRVKQLDTKLINSDFKEFVRRVRRDYTQFGQVEYVNVLELYQDKSGYHLHAVLFFNNSPNNVFIDIEQLEKLWDHGYAYISQPQKNKDVYFYLTPHLADYVNEKNEKMHNKALLQMELPAGQRLYKYSKGIKKPQLFIDNYSNVKKYLVKNSYTYERDNVYLNPMKTHRGNNLYYCKEYYKKETESAREAQSISNKRKPI